MGDMAEYYLDSMPYDADKANVFYDNLNEGPYYPIKLNRGPGKCPKCGSDTKLVTGKFGLFFGCTKFPECTGSRPYV